MRDSRSATRCATGRFGFRYGSPWALMTTTGLSSVTSAPVAVSWIGIVFASDGVVFGKRLDGERLHAARRRAGREGHDAARVGVVGAGRRGAAPERVVHRHVVVERLVAVRRQLDADRRGAARVDRVHRGRGADVRGGRAGVHAVERELVDVELAVARARRLGQREPAHLVQVERAVDRPARRLEVGAQLQRAERDLDQVPALPVVGEERLPELGMLGVCAAVLDLELVLLSRSGYRVVARVVAVEPELDAAEAAPVLRRARREVVAEAAVARVRDPGAAQHVVVRDAGRSSCAIDSVGVLLLFPPQEKTPPFATAVPGSVIGFAPSKSSITCRFW